MPTTRQDGGIGGTLDAVVRLAPGVQLAGIQLTAEEGFVLSRIDDQTSIENLCLISGLGEETTLEILRSLKTKGLVVIGDEPEPALAGPPTIPEPPLQGSPTIPDLIDPEEDRRVLVRVELEPSVQEEQSVADEEPTPTGAPALPEADGEDDEALIAEEDVDLDLDLRREIRTVHRKLGEMNLFELLGVSPFARPKEVRRAFFARSKRYHPDRFYGKRLGPYQSLLQEIFKQVRAASKFLGDESQLKAYREMVLEQSEQEALARKVEEEGARLFEEDQEAVSDASGPQVVEPEREPERRPRRRSLRADSVRKALVRMANVSGRARPQSQPVAPIEEEEEEEDPEITKRRKADRRRRAGRATGTFFVRAKRAGQFYKQGMAQMEKGQYLAATASLKLAVAFNPDDKEYAQRYSEAIEKSKETTAESYFKRAMMEESVGRYDAAGVNFVKAADNNPKPLYLCKASEALIASNELIKAKEYATKAVQSEPNSVDNRIALAKAYAAAKMYKNARRELQEALKIEPNNTDAKRLLKDMR